MDTTFIYFYECHLKAGSASGDISSRTTDCTTMRNYFNTLPATTNIVMGGDFNFYTNTEGGFQKLCHSGTNLLNDPTGQEGSWTSNITYASILTQSTRYQKSSIIHERPYSRSFEFGGYMLDDYGL